MKTETGNTAVVQLNNIVKSLQDKFEWLIIPMEIEAEISKSYEEGGSFADMDDYAICS